MLSVRKNEYPSKQTVNLVFRERSINSPSRAIPAFLLFLVFLALFVRFGVQGQLQKMTSAQALLEKVQADLNGLVEFHKSHGKIATITTVNIGQQKGVLDIGSDNVIHAFREKSANDGAVINGGFMVLNPEIFGYLKDDTTIFEQGPMQTLAEEGQLMSYYHDGFWQCMDTQREMKKLEALWQSGNAPWKIWK